MVTTTHYPLLLDYQGTLFGRGFVAEVSACGRLLASREDGEWWIYGVSPGAVAAEGETLEAAHEELRTALREIMMQFAEEAGSFEAFKSEVERFFNATNEETTAEWKAAVDRIRTTRDRLDDLPVKSAEKDCYVAVFRKHERDLTPENNVMRVESALVDAEAA